MSSLYSVIFSGLIIFQMIVMNILFMNYNIDLGNKFEENRLQTVVNYATEGAAKEMRDVSSDLGQDYTSFLEFNVDPTAAMETFNTLLLKNYDIPISAVNKQNIMMEYVPVFMVASYDGYYIGSHEKINTSGVENMIFSPKLPYLYPAKDADGNPITYSLNLGLENQLKIDAAGNVTKTTGVLDEKTQRTSINDTISDVLNTKLIDHSRMLARGNIYIPAEATTIGATNAIKNTTVFAYIDNFDLHGKSTTLQSFGIGGTEIKNKDVVVGFIIKNSFGEDQKYYTYAKDLPTGVTPVETFSTQTEAAESGYYFYIH